MNIMIKKYIYIPLILLFFINNLNAQIAAKIFDCNSIDVLINAEKITNFKSSVYVLEKEIAPDVWLSVTKKLNQLSRNYFSNLTPGVYRIKASETTKKGEVKKSPLLFSNKVKVKSCLKNKTINLSEIIVKPNPSSHILTIEVNDLIFVEKGEKLLNLYNYQGTVVKTTSLSNKNTSLNVSDLPKGLYIIELEINKRKMSQESVIIQ